MNTHSRPRAKYDVLKLVSDMTQRGWMATDLARASAMSDMTVSRFLKGERQTAKACKKMAEALGYTVRRYLIGVEGGERRKPVPVRRVGHRRLDERESGLPDRRKEAR